MSAPTKPRKAAAKRQPAPASVEPDEELEDDGAADDEPQPVGPIRIGGRPVEMLDVFEIDGVMFKAPKSPSPALTLEYIRQSRRAVRLKGLARTAAINEALESFIIDILGADAWRTLGESPEVSVDDVAAVVLKVSNEIAFPAVQKLQEASGNS